MFLEAAWRIGTRFERNAEWSSRGCAWRITKSDPADVWSRRAVSTMAGPWIYQGNAGIALFLSELYAMTGDESVRRCAEGALERALVDASKTSRSQIGFHTGFTGLAYALIR